MHTAVYLFSALILFQTCFALMGDLEYDTKLNVRVDHSFDDADPPTFTHRGEFFTKSLHSDLITFKQGELIEEDINRLKALAKKNGNYRIRASVKLSNGKENLFFSFAKACSLVESHLNDVFFVNLDSVGNVLSVTLAAPAICTGANVDNKYLHNFNTTVFVRHMDLGPVPDTASYIQKLEREREAKERGDAKDNRSFLSKYWIYILPFVVLFVLSSTSNMEAGANPQR